MLPRGIRNNNFGNIEDGAFARGLPGYVGSDGRFAQFSSPQDGLSAIDRLLGIYGSKHGINTVNGVISRWAPASDGNNVANYAGYVSNKLGVDPNQPIDLNDPNVRGALAPAMAEFENGSAAMTQAFNSEGSTPVPAESPAALSTRATVGGGALSSGDPSDAMFSAMQNAGAYLTSIADPKGGAALLAANAAHGRRGQRKVGLNPVWGTDAAGNPVLLQLTDDGKAVQPQLPPGVKPSSGIEEIKTPQGVYRKDRRDGRILEFIPNDNRGSKKDEAQGTGEGKIAAARPEMFKKATANIQRINDQTTLLETEIDRSLNNISEGSFGGALPTAGGGAILSGVPGTNAKSLKERLDTVKSNLGLDKLQELRDSSPTGGALGQVSNYENEILQKIQGSLDQAQDPQELVRNLQRLKEHLRTRRQRIQDAYQRDFGDLVPETTPTPQLPAGVKSIQVIQ